MLVVCWWCAGAGVGGGAGGGGCCLVLTSCVPVIVSVILLLNRLSSEVMKLMETRQKGETGNTQNSDKTPQQENPRIFFFGDLSV